MTPNVLFHPNIPLFEAGRIARAQGCVLQSRAGRLRLAPATQEQRDRLSRCLDLVDEALARIGTKDFNGAMACAREAKELLA